MADDQRTTTHALGAPQAVVVQTVASEPAAASVVLTTRAITVDAAELPSAVAEVEPPPIAAGLFATRPAYERDFFQALRRLEVEHRDGPRIGEALRVVDERIRLAQEPSLAFTATSLARFYPSVEDRPARLTVNFFGVFGPDGPLPLHLTEYARQRLHHHNDPTFSRFVDLFHHRLLSLFYRAWANSRPHVQHDRPEANRFLLYMSALVGRASPALQGRDAIPDTAKLYYAGRLSSQPRNAEGLRAILSDYFELPVTIEEFHGEWIDLPKEYGWKLGGRKTGALLMGVVGTSALLGPRVWSRQHKFRIVLGPLRADEFSRMLPGTPGVEALTAMVLNYIGDELAWDLRLTLRKEAMQPVVLGVTGQLGRTSWLLGDMAGGLWDDLVFDPQRETSQVNSGPARTQATTSTH